MTGTGTSASSAGAISPVIQFTCEAATSVVFASTASASCANGTARTVAPSRRAAISGPIRPGCSLSEVMISSPGPRSIPARTYPSPALVPVVTATCSASQPITRAYPARRSSVSCMRRSKCGHSRPSTASAAISVEACSAAARGIGPSVPEFR